MCESYTYGIEHPNQDTWVADNFACELSPQNRVDLTNRYADTALGSADLEAMFRAISNASMINRAHRGAHESGNRGSLGIGHIDDRGERGQLRAEYDQLTGRADKVSDFILWFSRVSHKAFVAQEQLAKKSFSHVSLELGGIRQYGDWNATKSLDGMIRTVPNGVLARDPEAHIVVYGHPKYEPIDPERVRHVDTWTNSYRLMPEYQLPVIRSNKESRKDEYVRSVDFAVVRRRRPIADIYIPGQSDAVIFKESLGLLVMPLIEPGVRKVIAEEYTNPTRKTSESEDADGAATVEAYESLGDKLAGDIIEDAIDSRQGETTNLIILSGHYVQGVGKKFARFREAA